MRAGMSRGLSLPCGGDGDRLDEARDEGGYHFEKGESSAGLMLSWPK
jgi:hypothetical protein